MSARYAPWVDGKGIEVAVKIRHKLACCDCGLVHDVVIVAPNLRRGRMVGVAIRRNARATAQRRRALQRRREGVFA